MSIVLTFNGATTLEGFLLVPAAGKTFHGQLGVRTSDGSAASVHLKVVAGGATVVLSQTHLNLTGVEQHITLHATSASHAKNDTVIQVLKGTVVSATLQLTA